MVACSGLLPAVRCVNNSSRGGVIHPGGDSHFVAGKMNGFITTKKKSMPDA